jgi:hypothetical protein
VKFFEKQTGNTMEIIEVIPEKLLTPYGVYVLQFAKNHGITIDEAYAHPTVRARLDYFNKTGK